MGGGGGVGEFWLTTIFFLAACLCKNVFLSTTLYRNFFPKKIASFPLSIKLIENNAALFYYRRCILNVTFTRLPIYRTRTPVRTFLIFSVSKKKIGKKNK